MLLVSANEMAAFGVELSFNVRNALFYSGVDGISAVVHSLTTNDEVLEKVYESEVVYHQHNIDFAAKCDVNFRFEKVQRFRITLYVLNSITQKIMGKLGECLFDLSVIFARGGSMIVDVPDTPSKIDIRTSVKEYYGQYLKLRLTGHHISSPLGLPLGLYFIMNIPIGHRTIMLYKSEIIKEDKKPYWMEFSIPLFVLNFYNESPIRIDVYNHFVNHPDEMVGYCTTSLTLLQRGPGTMNTYMLMKHDGGRIGEKTWVALEKCELDVGPTFFEMLKNTNMQLTEAIDLTASNGNPVSDTSLHFIHPHRPSAYLKTILQITPPFLAYLSHPENPAIGALGFGANVQNGNALQLSHCFYLNGTADEHRVQGLFGLIDSYQKARMRVQPFAPTDFSEVIYYVSKFAKAESRRHFGLYFVLLILSDGGPASALAMKKTIDAIVDASAHPMSIVAVGVGEDRNFSPMMSLESMTLKHSDGRMLVRQNYTFVRASDLEDSDALPMVPLQMIQWKKQFSNQP